MTLLVAVVGAVTLATVAGARRTSSTLERFRLASGAADLELDAIVTPDDVAKVADIPGVAAVSDLAADAIFFPAAPDFFSSGTARDAHFGTDIDRDRIVSGRAANPAAVDEVMMGEGLANRIGVRAGGTVDATAFTAAQILQGFNGSPIAAPTGPKLTLRVVGIVRRPVDLGESSSSGSLLMLTPAFARKYDGQVGVIGSRVRVRTDNGASDVPAVLASARKLLGQRLFSVQNFTVETQGAGNTIDVIAAALSIVAAIAALAGLVTIAIVLNRESAGVSREYNGLRELGCTRRQLVAMSAPAAGIIAGGGALLAVAGAIALSPLFPIGVARRAEPHPGVHVDALVATLGLGAIAAAVFAIALVAAHRATTASVASARTQKASIAERITGSIARPTTGYGVRMALEPGRGRRAVPVRSAIISAVIGVLGVTAVGVFTASLDHLVSTPAAYGSTWDFQTIDATVATQCDDKSHGLAQHPEIASLTKICGQNVEIAGRPVRGISFATLRGTGFRPGIVAGRAPIGAREVALGAKTLSSAHKHIGDTVRITGTGGTLEYVIVGQALLPNLSFAQPAADGATFTAEGYKPLLGFNLFLRYYVGSYAPDVSRPVAARAVDAIPELTPPVAPLVPVEIDRLDQINWLPIMLVLLFGALALVGVGHALVTGVRQRRRELSLLMALGFTRGQVRRTVAVQATTLAVIGLVLGIPAGIVVGTYMWRAVANGLGITVETRLPAIGVAVLIVAAIALVNILALFPARNAARTQPASGLRTD